MTIQMYPVFLPIDYDSGPIDPEGAQVLFGMYLIVMSLWLVSMVGSWIYTGRFKGCFADHWFTSERTVAFGLVIVNIIGTVILGITLLILGGALIASWL